MRFPGPEAAARDFPFRPKSGPKRRGPRFPAPSARTWEVRWAWSGRGRPCSEARRPSAPLCLTMTNSPLEPAEVEIEIQPLDEEDDVDVGRQDLFFRPGSGGVPRKPGSPREEGVDDRRRPGGVVGQRDPIADLGIVGRRIGREHEPAGHLGRPFARPVRRRYCSRFSTATRANAMAGPSAARRRSSRRRHPSRRARSPSSGLEMGASLIRYVFEAVQFNRSRCFRTRKKGRGRTPVPFFS